MQRLLDDAPLSAKQREAMCIALGKVPMDLQKALGQLHERQILEILKAYFAVQSRNAKLAQRWGCRPDEVEGIQRRRFEAKKAQEERERQQAWEEKQQATNGKRGSAWA